LTLKDYLKPGCTQRSTHPTLGCVWFNLTLIEEKLDEYVVYAAQAVRESYVDSKYLASVFRHEGFDGVARLFSDKLPPEDNRFGVRTGDFGEIIGHTVLQDLLGCKIPVQKLRYKTNWEKAAFGVDIIAFRLDDQDDSKDAVIFAEVKASKTKAYGVKDVFEEITSLVEVSQPEAKQKMRNAVRFVTERLFEQKQFDLEKRIYRFLDCYTHPQYIEAFCPLLVRDKRTWKDDALDAIALSDPQPNRVILCIFIFDDLERTIQAVFDKAANMEVVLG
jgi:hypothetical protein